MTRRLQIRIMAVFIIVFLVFVGFFAYGKIMAAPLILTTNKFVRTVGYSPSDKAAIIEIRWKEEMKASSVKDKNNYLIEHVEQRNGKWLTAVNGKKCSISIAQHVPDKLDPDHKGKVTQLSVYIEPKEAVDDHFRVRVRNVMTKKGEVMDNVEYGVVLVSNFAKFTKK
jgi:hypothetical protein